MTIKHHLTDDLLMAYSAGSLPEAFDLVIATHVSMCDECRARLAAFDEIGGAILEDCDVAAVSDGALDAVFARIEAGTSAKSPIDTGRTKAERGPFPAPLHDYIAGDLGSVKWRTIGGGVQQAVLTTSKDATARLFRIPAGTVVPDHGHRGVELTLVLQGAFRDDRDRFGRGDIEVATADDQHTPVAEDGEDCICLAATDAPLRFNALIPRIAQPFLRI